MTPPLEPNGDESAEELAQPDRRSNLRRLRLDLAVGAVVLLVILLLTRQHSGGQAASAPTTTPNEPPTGTSSHSFAIPSLEPTVHDPGHLAPDPRLRFIGPRPCPRATDGQNGCSTYPSISAPFAHAVRAAYPGLRIESAVTQMLRASDPGVRPGLWYAVIVGRRGPLQLRIAVDRAEPGDRQRGGVVVGSRPHGRSVVFVDSVYDGYRVQVEVTAPNDAPPDEHRIYALARNPRLHSPPAATMDR